MREVTRIHMSKSDARKWLLSIAKPEYCVKIYYSGGLCKQKRYRYCQKVLSFKNGASLSDQVYDLSDLSFHTNPDGLILRSTNFEGLRAVVSWFESKGHFSTGVW